MLRKGHGVISRKGHRKEMCELTVNLQDPHSVISQHELTVN